MNTINGMRAKLLVEKELTNSAYSFSEMLDKIMKMPSFTEKECCTKALKNFPIVKLNSVTFNGDFKNLEQAIEANFPEDSQCEKCKRSPKLERTFQPQIFIEVKLLFLFVKFRFYTTIAFHDFFLLFSDVFL